MYEDNAIVVVVTSTATLYIATLPFSRLRMRNYRNCEILSHNFSDTQRAGNLPAERSKSVLTTKLCAGKIKIAAPPDLFIEPTSLGGASPLFASSHI